MARVWMNHSFSTAYNIISLMRDAIPEIEMVGSNEHLYSPIMNVCDEWYQEPVLKGEQYVSFCLERRADASRGDGRGAGYAAQVSGTR